MPRPWACSSEPAALFGFAPNQFLGEGYSINSIDLLKRLGASENKLIIGAPLHRSIRVHAVYVSSTGAHILWRPTTGGSARLPRQGRDALQVAAAPKVPVGSHRLEKT